MHAVHKRDGERTLCPIGRDCWSLTYHTWFALLVRYWCLVFIHKFVPSLVVQGGDPAIVLEVLLWSSAMRNADLGTINTYSSKPNEEIDEELPS